METSMPVKESKKHRRQKDLKKEAGEQDEGATTLAGQIIPPFLCAGLGMVLAGQLLDRVQRWPVFSAHPELFTMVPALLGLKGNLEMTLASRLGTLANTGGISEDGGGGSSFRRVAVCNLALVQAQGIVVGLVAALLPMAATALWTSSYSSEKGLLLAASSVCTASVASFLLGLVMLAVIRVSSRLGVDPDNVATPIAASLGDLVTLALLVGFASVFHRSMDEVADGLAWLPSAAMAAFMVILPVCATMANGHEQTARILRSGWTPVLSAMAISSAGGKILEGAIGIYPGMASYQPVINGVAGNLVAVHASRLSTRCHKLYELGKPVGPDEVGQDRSTAFLLMLVVPGHLVLQAVMGYLGGTNPFVWARTAFLSCYLLSCLTQVWLLLTMSRVLVRTLWSHGVDPDDAAIPYLTAAGDLLGGIFLALTFFLTQGF